MPDYNSIDSIQGENVFRFGVHNKLQTKRDGQMVNLVDWNVYTRLEPAPQYQPDHLLGPLFGPGGQTALVADARIADTL